MVISIFGILTGQVVVAPQGVHRPFLMQLKSSFLEQLVDCPTRDRYINDLVLTNNSSIVHNVSVGHPFGNSDHKAIHIDVHMFQPKKATYTRKVYLYSKGHYADMDKYISGHKWEDLFKNCRGMDHMWSTFKSVYLEAVDKYVPHINYSNQEIEPNYHGLKPDRYNEQRSPFGKRKSSIKCQNSLSIMSNC